jgi:peptidoglycan pentaglycine glycine transferase (the first glycine)
MVPIISLSIIHYSLGDSTDDRARYDLWVQQHPHGTFWQSSARKAYAEACGLQTSIVASRSQNGEIEASALIIQDKGKWGTTWEIARGPIWTNDRAARALILSSIEEVAKKEGVTAVFLSPVTPLLGKNWKPSRRSIHPEATRIIDLTKTEEEILSQMHQKGRYNIRVAEKSNVIIRHGTEEDVHAFYQLLTGTGNRDGFKVHPESQYRRFLTSLEGSFLLIAEHEKKPVSGLLGVIWNGVGMYYYGASSYEDRALMAPYLLQWEAMRLCKAAGCKEYDLLGISPPDAVSQDSWSGISDFKRKFGGTVRTYPPEHMIVLRPIRKMLIDLKRKVLG